MQHPSHIDGIDWQRPVTLWHKGRTSNAKILGICVAEGPLADVVSRAVALNPIERNDLVIMDDASSSILDWRQILELESRQDFPFSI